MLCLSNVLKSLFSSGPATAPSRSPATAATASRPTVGASYSIVALDTVFVRVTHRIGEDTDGEEIFKGTLTKGQSQVIP